MPYLSVLQKMPVKITYCPPRYADGYVDLWLDDILVFFDETELYQLAFCNTERATDLIFKKKVSK